jgi:hypothetical protein
LYSKKKTMRGWIRELAAAGFKPELVILKEMLARRDVHCEDFSRADATAKAKAVQKIRLRALIWGEEARWIGIYALAGGCDLNGAADLKRGRKYLLTHPQVAPQVVASGCGEDPQAMPPTHVCLKDTVWVASGSGQL